MAIWIDYGMFGFCIKYGYTHRVTSDGVSCPVIEKSLKLYVYFPHHQHVQLVPPDNHTLTSIKIQQILLESPGWRRL